PFKPRLVQYQPALFPQASWLSLSVKRPLHLRGISISPITCDLSVLHGEDVDPFGVELLRLTSCPVSAFAEHNHLVALCDELTGLMLQVLHRLGKRAE